MNFEVYRAIGFMVEIQNDNYWFNYLYSKQELKLWIDKMNKIKKVPK